MYNRQAISVGSLALDQTNYRIVPQTSEKGARDAIIAEQGKKLVTLAKDILKEGLNPCDPLLVIDDGQGQSGFIVIEGNRRLTAIKLMLSPELAEGTTLFTAFKRLNTDHADDIPKVLDCVICASKAAGKVWIDRKHQGSLDGAGTEPWKAMAKARADADAGEKRPDLDVVNFVLTNPALSADVRTILEGSGFSITSLERLVKSKEVQSAVGFEFQEGKLVSEQSKERIQSIMSDVVTVIATGKHKGKKFTERDIDNEDKQVDFIASIIEGKPKKQRGGQRWQISGKPIHVKKPVKARKMKGTLSTEEQPNLIPRGFKLELPPGKINDVFVELKGLNVTPYRHAVSVLFRVFFEMSLDDYIKKHSIQLPKDGSGRVVDKLQTRLQFVKQHAKDSGLMTEKELHPLKVAISATDSLLSPDTLNAYVHSRWMNPDPLQLKLTWANLQLCIERLWGSKPPA